MYFLQVAKDDNFRYELLKHCKGCVTSSSGDTPYETYRQGLEMLRYIDSEMKRRENIVKERLGRRSEDINIHIYNKKFKDKLPVIQLWVDEAASLYKKTGDKEIDKMIAESRYIVERIASTGRYIGVYIVNVMQRASKDEIAREIKINTLNWISFKQVDAGASKVAIGDETSTLGLPQRVFAYKAGTECVSFAKTPFTRWDTNVKHLELQGKIKEDSKEVFEKDYSHWLNLSSKRHSESINKAKEDKRSKIVDGALKNAENELIKATEKISELEFDLNNKSKALENLVKENKILLDKVNNVEVTVDNNNESSCLNSLKDINNEYVSASIQKEEVNKAVQGKSYGKYKPIDLNSLPSINVKRK